MKIENISWISLSAGWSSKKKRHLSVSDGLLGKIVIDNQSVSSVVSEEFSNSASRIWSQELKRSGIRGGGGNDTGVFHGAKVLEGLDNVGNGGSLLSNGNVDAIKSLGEIALGESHLLVNDGINSNGSLSSLSITNNQLSLSSSNWHKGID